MAPLRPRSGRGGTRWQVARSLPFFCTRQSLPALISLLLSAASIGRCGSDDLLRPLPHPYGPTAAYGEVFPGRFHPGIDLQTGGRELPVAAAADGEIVRLRISGGGYRRAVHLALPDGREIVYAHLSRFAKAIEDSCRAIQKSSRKYELDWRPPRGMFPVIQGSWLGWTGETEDGRAMLHVEVRIDDVPLNPLTSGMSWPDSYPPTILSIDLVPLGPDAEINGAFATHSSRIWRVDGRVVPLIPVVVWGKIGVECESVDECLSETIAPWRVRLDVDDVVLIDTDIGTAVREGALPPGRPDQKEPSVFRQRCYSVRDPARGALLCNSELTPGPHRLRVILEDASGNADTVIVPLIVRPSPTVKEWMARPLADGAWDLGVLVSDVAQSDLDAFQLSIELTDDGRSFPVKTRLGHLGDGWFFGEVSSFTPSGEVGLRIRMRTSDSIETWEPLLSLDPAGRCFPELIGSPTFVPSRSWLEIAFPQTCMPAKAPTASLTVAGERIECDLLKAPPTSGGEAEWRFVCPAVIDSTGTPPILDLTVTGADRRWSLDDVVAVNPGTDLLWTSPDGALTLEIPAATFYAPGWLVWAHEPTGEMIPEGEYLGSPASAPGKGEQMLVRSDLHRVGPAGIEIDGVFRVAIRPRTPPETVEETRRLGIYGRPDAGAGWTLRPGAWTGEAVVAVVDRLEEWILCEDRTEPWLYALDPGPGDRRRGAVGFLRARVREDGSGIAADGVELLLDGRPIPAEWNPHARSITARVDDCLKPGRHVWEVSAIDLAGNRAVRTARFIVIAQQ